MSVDEPANRLQLRDGSFEVRDYSTLVNPAVAVSGGQNQAAGLGFRILAAYIAARTRGASVS